MFTLVLREELRKSGLRKIFFLILLAPFLYTLLMYANFGLPFRKEYFISINKFDWDNFLTAAAMGWTLMIYPLVITVVTAMTSLIEHRDNGWKHLLALPIKRGDVYLAKFLVALILLTASMGLVITFIYLLGVIIDIKGKLSWVFFASLFAYPYLASFSLMAIQFWLGNRFRNPVVPLSLGFVSTVVAFYFAQWSGPGKYLPNVYPLTALPLEGGNPVQGVFLSVITGLIFIRLGLQEFKRRDIL